jgi:hypothetical protein
MGKFTAAGAEFAETAQRLELRIPLRPLSELCASAVNR